MATKQTKSTQKVVPTKKTTSKAKTVKPEKVVENLPEAANAEENISFARAEMTQPVANEPEVAHVPESVATPDPIKEEKKGKEEKPLKEEKPKKQKVDMAKVAEFRRVVAGSSNTRSSIVKLAQSYFGDDFQMHDGLSFKEVYFTVGGVRIPESGIFPLRS